MANKRTQKRNFWLIFAIISTVVSILAVKKNWDKISMMLRR